MVVEIMELPTPPNANQLTFLHRQQGEKAWNKYTISAIALVLSEVPSGDLVKTSIENVYGEPVDFLYVPYRGEL